MKTYELIIERRQPACGGKDPKEVKVLTVTTDDPVAYVREIEKTDDLQVEVKPDGEIVVCVEIGLKRIQYSFAED